MSAEFESVPAEIAAKMIAAGECYVIDVRTPQEFADHRVAGAHLLPIQELGQRHGEIPRNPDKKLLILCEHGVRSRSVCEALSQNGWKNVVDMSGGMAHWIGAGLPFVSGTIADKENHAPPAQA